MKLSLYSFEDLERCYGILQFEKQEEGLLLEKLSNLDVSALKSILEKCLLAKVKGISIAKGKLYYEEQELDMVYLRVDLDDNREYSMEVYRESAMVISNSSSNDTLSDLTSLVKALVPGIRFPRTTLLGF